MAPNRQRPWTALVAILARSSRRDRSPCVCPRPTDLGHAFSRRAHADPGVATRIFQVGVERRAHISDLRGHSLHRVEAGVCLCAIEKQWQAMRAELLPLRQARILR